MQPYTFLASLPALLGFCGFIVYQILGSHGRGGPITQKIIDKLRRDAPGAVKPDQRLAPAELTLPLLLDRAVVELTPL